jgi:hypothetical protein
VAVVLINALFCMNFLMRTVIFFVDLTESSHSAEQVLNDREFHFDPFLNSLNHQLRVANDGSFLRHFFPESLIEVPHKLKNLCE